MSDTTPDPSCLLLIDENQGRRDATERHLSRTGWDLQCLQSLELAKRMLVADPERWAGLVLQSVGCVDTVARLLREIAAHPPLHGLPVVVSTDSEALVQQIPAEVRFAWAAPGDAAAIQAALRAYPRRQSAASVQSSTLQLLQSGCFYLRNLDEARRVATLVAAVCPDPTKALHGVNELLINAIEHGNLGISYQQKGELIRDGGWEDEVERRLEDPAHRDKRVKVAVEQEPSAVVITITDQGQGFDWRPFMEISTKRMRDAHGRGIALAAALSFDAVEYRGCGNQVVARINR